MRRAWVPLVAIVGSAVVTVVVTLQTPDGKVPVVGIDEFSYPEAQRTLTEVALLLQENPELSVEDLRDDYSALLDVSGKEPAGLLWGVMGVAIGALGTFALTRAGNRFGIYLIWVGGVAAIAGVSRALSDLEVQSASTSLPLSQLAFALADTFWIPLGVFLGPLMILTFPNGKVLSANWRWVMWLASAATLLLFIQLLHPLRYDGRALASYRGPGLEGVNTIFISALFAWQLTLLAASVSLVVRYVRSKGDERQQLKWVTFGVGFSIVALALSDVAQRAGGSIAFWGPIGSAGFFGVVPLAFLFSLFRYRLYSVDVVINKSITFGAISLGVAGLYVSVLALVAGMFGAGRLVAAFAAMVVAAMLLEPMRHRVTSFVDRIVYRRATGPYSALSGLSQRLASEYELDVGMAELAASVARATGSESVTVWTKSGDTWGLAAAEPIGMTPDSPAEFDLIVPIGDVGLLAIRLKRGESIRRSERMLIEDVASLAAHLIENVRLRDQLSATVASLRARQDDLSWAESRLVEIVADTRSQIERDLHDGAQARVIALGAAIGLARVQPSPESVESLTNEIDAANIVVDRFAHGLYPVNLDRHGLGSLLSATARSIAPDAAVSVGDVDASPEIEWAAFFVAAEGIVNAVKHAPGSDVSLVVKHEAGFVEVVVSDNGPGFEYERSSVGSGLINLSERIETLDGTLDVTSIIGQGTTLVARVPVADDA